MDGREQLWKEAEYLAKECNRNDKSLRDIHYYTLTKENVRTMQRDEKIQALAAEIAELSASIGANSRAAGLRSPSSGGCDCVLSRRAALYIDQIDLLHDRLSGNQDQLEALHTARNKTLAQQLLKVHKSEQELLGRLAKMQ